jgi:hypothetical protein
VWVVRPWKLNLTPFSGRSAFRDAGAGRLLYRARFHERIAGS